MDDNGYVALSEKVTATFYDDEHEEWTQKTMTIADILDSVCDDYTMIPSAQPETYKEKLKEIADALSEKFAYMNTCLNERDIILGYLGVKRPSKTHCNTDCTNIKCESYRYNKRLPSVQPKIKTDGDTISRQAAIDAARKCAVKEVTPAYMLIDKAEVMTELMKLPSAQPERKWTPCSNPPKHHKDVIVRGIEAIGNVTVHKVMQWDVDTWRPTDYAPSIMWKEWSEI